MDQPLVYTPPHRRGSGGRDRVLSARSLPLASIMKEGDSNNECCCELGEKELHISAFAANMGEKPIEGFCANAHSMFQPRLPCWSTGLQVRVSFTDIPTVAALFTLFTRATYWWKTVKGKSRSKYGNPMWLSRTARLILFASTGKSLKDLKFLSTEDLLKMPCSSPGLSRVRNFIITLDGLMISLFLAGESIQEMNNWTFYDRVVMSYMHNAVHDLYKDTGSTYYSCLKSVRNYVKDKALKERATASFDEIDKSKFWYLKFLFKYHWEGKSILSIQGLRALSYFTQTRACGLPPRPLIQESIEKFLETAQEEPERKTDRERADVSYACRQILTDMNGPNWGDILNRALLEAKISVSNSSSLETTREDGGKAESARYYFRGLIGQKIPIFDLETGRVARHSLITESSPIGETLFHYSIAFALKTFRQPTTQVSLSSDKVPTGGFFDCWLSTVLEAGKARVITVPHYLHSALLHPMSHVLSVFVATLESSRTGMKASNHMWDFYKRMVPNLVPADGIFPNGEEPGRKMFLGSEDWSEATDRLNPFVASQIIQEICLGLGLPTFYTQLCAKVLTHQRRIFYADRETGSNRQSMTSFIIKKNGVLQGDPLTKQVLHLSHNVSRKIAESNVNRICHKLNFGFPVTAWGSKTFRPFPISPIMTKLSREESLKWAMSHFLERSRVDDTTRMSLLKDSLTPFQKG